MQAYFEILSRYANALNMASACTSTLAGIELLPPDYKEKSIICCDISQRISQFRNRFCDSTPDGFALLLSAEILVMLIPLVCSRSPVPFDYTQLDNLLTLRVLNFCSRSFRACIGSFEEMRNLPAYLHLGHIWRYNIIGKRVFREPTFCFINMSRLGFNNQLKNVRSLLEQKPECIVVIYLSLDAGDRRCPEQQFQDQHKVLMRLCPITSDVTGSVMEDHDGYFVFIKASCYEVLTKFDACGLEDHQLGLSLQDIPVRSNFLAGGVAAILSFPVPCGKKGYKVFDVIYFPALEYVKHHPHNDDVPWALADIIGDACALVNLTHFNWLCPYGLSSPRARLPHADSAFYLFEVENLHSLSSVGNLLSNETRAFYPLRQGSISYEEVAVERNTVLHTFRSAGSLPFFFFLSPCVCSLGSSSTTLPTSVFNGMVPERPEQRR